MKRIIDILKNVDLIESIGDLETRVSSLEFDSRKVITDSLFIATKGTQVDGHNYIFKAIELGAIAIVCEEIPEEKSEDVIYIKVENSQKALGLLASKWFNEPSSQLKLIGVTGTNGKTTIATLLHKLFSQLGYYCGLLSTIENKIGEQIIPSTHTTPDAIALNALLAEMVEKGCGYCFMEVSSHALDQGRTAGLDFDGAIFTNLSHDHLDYHIDFASYIKAKKSFFDHLKKSAFAITNEDDRNGMVILQNCKAIKKTYSLRTLGDFNARIIENQINGLNLIIDGQDVWFRLTGEFNAYNLLAIYGTAIMLDQDKDEVLSQMSTISSANGRFDLMISPSGITAIVDYAHTPDALENVLKTIQDINTDNGKVFTVVGAGGNRDKTKRPEMAKIGAQYSQQLILTSDNPRFENPEDIIMDMKAGLNPSELRKTLAITNREEAIKTAFAMAQTKDIILIAGKGHETYQETNGKRQHFDDKEVINNLFKQA
ncbi:UDP-N-acetylmuramoyl-L-alanyl-D-glutamate--2,6-diaminopimelate ligase [Lentimicrobium sp. L6]|uniref:UDP-N-acetylmuramoyl-L-alanyl-D-glutamate--2, 6-diaminopimelate ligase n=1 Tax=Lentimicrobium sp. L6 TaxID=2735916 RepID=UPI00155336A0|nr:UDP-N-acetylmuramoyl-L-alanyl-D-glutamate--2,6-diaminopimelate ligase [Lentimicrobium sp. L6]NPD84572.1 UDP-N-acetylmuramoyl-L-alanyl-D-glutamate--2,6-diaminopimelate ligase [Lentimicrobium sp. L6]